jgi:Squalene-hopene cyclase C-terminal domain
VIRGDHGAVVGALRARPVRPSQLAVIAGDVVRAVVKHPGGTPAMLHPTGDTAGPGIHLRATMDWLCRAQDVGQDRGVSWAYTFRGGWWPSYPETTGYIVPTFLDYAHFARQPAYRDRALEMGEWLLSIQMPGGAFQGGRLDQPPRPSVFNTGQILFGLVRLARETSDDRYSASLRRAADWLVSVQDADGPWSHSAYNGISHTYYTRVAWALLEAAAITGQPEHRERAIAQLEWALSNQQPNGWFSHNGFEAHGDPFTHNIVYAAEGLLGAGLVLEEERYTGSALRVAVALQQRFDSDGFLPGTFDANWSSTARYSCLTGDAQLAGLLLGLSRHTGDRSLAETAARINRYVAVTQRLRTRNGGIRGGVRGSEPIWGAYQPYSYPNWAAKFFVDSLLLEAEVLSDVAASVPR